MQVMLIALRFSEHRSNIFSPARSLEQTFMGKLEKFKMESCSLQERAARYPREGVLQYRMKERKTASLFEKLILVGCAKRHLKSKVVGHLDFMGKIIFSRASLKADNRDI